MKKEEIEKEVNTVLRAYVPDTLLSGLIKELENIKNESLRRKIFNGFVKLFTSKFEDL